MLLAGNAAAAPLSLELGAGDGIGYASRAGSYRDDGVVSLRLGIGLNCRTALDVGLSGDLERIEPGLHVGTRVRMFELPWLPYLRGDVALIGGSKLGSNFDLAVGIGVWNRLARRFAWYVELDAIGRVGEVETLTARVEIGLAFATLAFWR
jgi:hypothetical protein